MVATARMRITINKETGSNNKNKNANNNSTENENNNDNDNESDCNSGGVNGRKNESHNNSEAENNTGHSGGKYRTGLDARAAPQDALTRPRHGRLGIVNSTTRQSQPGWVGGLFIWIRS